MQSLRLLVGANLRRRRGEILLVALSIAVATMSLATAIPILLGVSRSIDVTFDFRHADLQRGLRNPVVAASPRNDRRHADDADETDLGWVLAQRQ
jgi:hypothetical protein